MPSHRTSQLPSWTWHALSFLLAFNVVAVVGSRMFMSDGLLGLYLGRYVGERGIPRVDDLTIAGADRPWVDQQWLAQLVYYRAWDLGGYALTALTSAFAISLAFLLLSVVLHRRGVPGLQVLAWVGLALVVVVNNTIIRAQSFALLLFMVVVAMLLADERSERPRARYWLVILAALMTWANVHGSLLLVIPVVSAWAFARAVRVRATARRDALQWAGYGLLAPLTVLATPYGLDILGYYRSVIANDAIAELISEWQPANPASLTSLPFLAFLLLLVVAISFRWGRGVRPPMLQLAMVAWFGLVGTQAIRYHMWVAIPGVLLLSSIVRLPTSATEDDARRARRLLAPVGAVLAIGAATTCVAFTQMSESTWLETLPVEEVHATAEWMRDHPDATVLADDQAAPTLLWLHPDVAAGRVAYDARLEHFSQDDLRAFLEFADARTPSWLDATRDHDALVVSRLYHPRTARLVRDLDGWRVEARSRRGLLLVRDGSDAR